MFVATATCEADRIIAQPETARSEASAAVCTQQRESGTTWLPLFACLSSSLDPDRRAAKRTESERGFPVCGAGSPSARTSSTQLHRGASQD
jgi:hypothetical protein